jgi:hypothetical protein
MSKHDVPIMKIDLSKRKLIYLNRATITLLGNPPHLIFKFDTPNKRLIVLPTFVGTLDTYEIPKYYWHDERSTCQISRLPFILSLSRKFGWNDRNSYRVQGVFQTFDAQKLIVFNLDEVAEIPCVETENYH